MSKVRLEWNGKKALFELSEAMLDGLHDAGEHLLGVSRGQVPLEEATLERSGQVSQNRAAKRVAVSYDTPYAVYQHERLDLHHDEGRKAKYLEDPMNSEQVVMRKLIAHPLEEKLK